MRIRLDPAVDEAFQPHPRRLVRPLLGRRLHEIGRWREERALQPAIHGDLAGADGVDDHPRRVRGVPHLELDFQVDGLVAERAPLEPDVGPLAVVEPRHVIARPDVDVLGSHLVGELRAHRVRLGDLLRDEPGALEHVQEVGVAAHVELTRVLHVHAAVHEEFGQDAVHDGGAHLRLDVVTHDGQATLLEAPPPVLLAGDEYRDAVHEAAARVEDLLDVPLGCHFAAYGEEVDHHIRAGLAQNARDVHGGAGSLGNDLREVVAEAVVGHAALHGHVEVRYLAEAHGVVGLGPDRLREVEADLVGVHVEGSGELDVADVVVGEARPHQPRDETVVRRVLVVVDALHEGRGAVADSDDRDAYWSHVDLPVRVDFDASAYHSLPR